MQNRGLRRAVAAEYICCSPSKFGQLVSDGDMPAPGILGSIKIWDRLERDVFFDGLPRCDDEADDINA